METRASVDLCTDICRGAEGRSCACAPAAGRSEGPWHGILDARRDSPGGGGGSSPVPWVCLVHVPWVLVVKGAFCPAPPGCAPLFLSPPSSERSSSYLALPAPPPPTSPVLFQALTPLLLPFPSLECKVPPPHRETGGGGSCLVPEAYALGNASISPVDLK